MSEEFTRFKEDAPTPPSRQQGMVKRRPKKTPYVYVNGCVIGKLQQIEDGLPWGCRGGRAFLIIL
jgi:hypothetical protein